LKGLCPPLTEKETRGKTWTEQEKSMYPKMKKLAPTRGSENRGGGFGGEGVGCAAPPKQRAGRIGPWIPSIKRKEG